MSAIPSIKLPESIGRAADKVAKFFTGKKNVDIDRHKRLTEAQTDIDVKAIESGKAVYRNKQLIEIFEPLLADTQQGFEIEEQNNFKDCLMTGLDQISRLPDEDVSDEDLDNDWMLRWRQTARLTGHPELQGLVGKILAEEVKSNSISYRTLDVIKNLSKKDLEIFIEMAPYIMPEYAALIKPYSWTSNAILFQKLLTLCSAGIITMINDTVSGTTKSSASPLGVLFAGFVFILPDADKVEVPCCSLTEAGQDLYPILNFPEASEEQIRFIAEFIAFDKNNKFKPNKQKVEVYKYVNGRYNPSDIIMTIDPNAEKEKMRKNSGA